jgi:hypothetical protein
MDGWGPGCKGPAGRRDHGCCLRNLIGNQGPAGQLAHGRASRRDQPVPDLPRRGPHRAAARANRRGRLPHRPARPAPPRRPAPPPHLEAVRAPGPQGRRDLDGAQAAANERRRPHRRPTRTPGGRVGVHGNLREADPGRPRSPLSPSGTTAPPAPTGGATTPTPSTPATSPATPGTTSPPRAASRRPHDHHTASPATRTGLATCCTRLRQRRDHKFSGEESAPYHSLNMSIYSYLRTAHLRTDLSGQAL